MQNFAQTTSKFAEDRIYLNTYIDAKWSVQAEKSIYNVTAYTFSFYRFGWGIKRTYLISL